MLNIGWDTETHLIAAPNSIIPPIVCGSWDAAPEGHADSQWRDVASTGDPELWDFTRRMWQSTYQGDSRIIIHNAAFDVCVALRYCQDVLTGHRPGDRTGAGDLYYLIWETLEKSMDNEWDRKGPILVSDTMIRDKLLNLSKHGSMLLGPKGGKISYSLADTVYRRLRKDIRSGKVSADGQGRIYDAEGNDITGTSAAGAAWRLRYRELDGVPTRDWPMEAWIYAWDDAYYARMVWEKQREIGTDSPTATHGTMRSESLQVYSSIALNLYTATGFDIDQEQARRVTSAVSQTLERVEQPLRDNGIIRSNGSVNMKLIKSRIDEIWEWIGRAPLLTASGDIATSKEVMEILSDYDPMLEIYSERQKLAKLRDAFLPSLQGERVYTNFDNPKETGRSSSFGAREKKGRKPLYEAINSQQMPRKEGVREILLPPPPPPGCAAPYMLINSDDYGAVELCGTGQATYSLFGRSVHRDKINAGYDLHTYLGSAIAMVKFPELVSNASDLDVAYDVLMQHRKYRAPEGYFDEHRNPIRKDSEVEDRLHLAGQAKHCRNMAKPVGLGYPGGLAERTMIVFAKTVYKVDMTETEASELKELWFHIYPEMVDYFRWVRGARDFVNKDEHGDAKYCYLTPGFGRFRAGATYCATANGAAMQSLAADGAKRSACWIARAMSGGLEPTNPFRILDQCYPLTFIHDENLTAIPADPLATERSMAITQLMVQALQMHMPDVRISAEPALMRRWRKGAEAEWVADRDGERERAHALAVQTYGWELGTQMIQQFATPDGYRLVPHETIHGESIKAVA